VAIAVVIERDLLFAMKNATSSQPAFLPLLARLLPCGIPFTAV